MTSKKRHPIFNKSKKNKKAKPRARKWLVALLLLPIFIVGYLISSQPSSDTIVTPIANAPAIADEAKAPDPAIVEADSDIESESAEINNAEDTPNAILDNSQALETPNPEAILNAPLPQTNSLAKEEIDRLADEQRRLKEQEKMVAEQVAMTKSLTEMKDEQIELLERQIAELEAKQAAQ